MPLTPGEERRVERLLREAAAEGRRIGADEALRGVIESRSRQAARADYREAAGVAGRYGTFADALYRLARLFLPGSVARWRRVMRPVVNDVAETATRTAAPVLGRFDARRPAANDFLEDYVSELSDHLAETTYRNVMEALREAEAEGLGVPEAAARIRASAAEIGETRAKNIAANELQRITKGASWAQARDSGVIRGKKRHEEDDARTRPSHRILDGEERGIDEPYSNGEMWAGQTEINCRGWDEFLIDWDALDERGAEPPEDPELEEPEERPDPHDEIAAVFEDPEALTREEAEAVAARIAARAARRGFDTAARERAGDVRGMEHEGEVLTRRALLRPDVRHWLKHVVRLGEWPEGTDLEGYTDGVRRVTEDPETYVFVNRFEGREQVGFLRRSGELRGPEGYEWILVEYVLATGHVRTAFQPETGLEWVTDNPKREIVRWLRGPE